MSDQLAAVRFDFSEEGVVTRSNVAGHAPLPAQGYFLDDKPLERGLSTAVDPRFADWLEIAHAAYFSDRLVRRPWTYERSPSAAWTRRLHLRLPVRDVEFWRSDKVSGLLIEILNFLTEDIWSFEFIASKLPRYSEGQRYLFGSVSGPAEVALLSAGLDSFSGAVIRRHALPETHFVFVSAATGDMLGSRQAEQFSYLRGIRPHLATHILLKHHLSDPPGRADLETSQRSRGFLHLTLGCVAALTIKAGHLHVYENGVGAINLPLDGSQLGALNSRPVNPCTLIQMSKMAQLVGESRGFQIVNPFLLLTKGQMCAAPPVREAATLLRRTLSCDRPTRRTGRLQCGSCSSCVLRRLSLHASGLHGEDPGAEYDCDLFDADTFLSHRRWLAFDKMRWQVGVMERAIASVNPWEALASEFWMLPRVASILRMSEERPHPEADLVELFRRYVQEWRTFPVKSGFVEKPFAA